MAYVLGYIAADGTLIKTKRGTYFTEIQSTDKVILYSIRDALQSNLIIGEYQPRNKAYNRRYRLQIGSRTIFNDLVALGITPRKSKTITLPSVPETYFSHFVRGYFDGDGCVNICTYKRKDRGSLFIVLNSGFTSGSKQFLSALHDRLKSLSVVNGGTSYYHSRSYRLWFSIRDSLRLYQFMYRELRSDLFLIRKRAVFEKYLKR